MGRQSLFKRGFLLPSRTKYTSLSGALILALLLVLCPLTSVSADQEVVISVEDVDDVEVGDNFSVGLEIETAVPVRGIQLDLAFSDKKMVCNSISSGSFFSTYASQNGLTILSESSGGLDYLDSSKSAGELTNINYALIGAAAGGPVGRGLVCTVRFTAENSAASGTQITPTNVVVSGVDGTSLDSSRLSIESGKVKIAGSSSAETDDTGSVPAIPVPVSPGTASGPGPQITSLTPVFTWSDVSDADYYMFLVKQGTSLVYTSPNVTAISFSIPAGKLAAGGSYSWSVRAGNANGWSSASSPFYFRTPTSASGTATSSPTAASGTATTPAKTTSPARTTPPAKTTPPPTTPKPSGSPQAGAGTSTPATGKSTPEASASPQSVLKEGDDVLVFDFSGLSDDSGFSEEYRETGILTDEKLKIELSIDEGTSIVNSSGEFSESISVENRKPSAAQEEAGAVTIWDIKPGGLNFSPSILFTFQYEPDWIPEKSQEKDLTLAYYDSSKKEWVKVDSRVNPGDSLIRGKIPQSGLVALIAKQESGISPAVWGGIGAGVLIIVLGTWIFVRRLKSVKPASPATEKFTGKAPGKSAVPAKTDLGRYLSSSLDSIYPVDGKKGSRNKDRQKK